METNPDKPVHAHDLLSLLSRSSVPMPYFALQEAVERAFGPSPLFTNCTGQHYSLDEIIRFLLSRNKITQNNGGFMVVQANVCSDD